MDELPYKAKFGVWGSWLCVFINAISIIAQFYVALYPIGGPYLDAETFFTLFLSGPLLIGLYLGWRIYSWIRFPAERKLFLGAKDIDIYTGMREGQLNLISGQHIPEETRRASIVQMKEEQRKKGPLGYIKAGVRNLI